jgi:5-formyltetrahydrofolate cyclo-ligase
MKDALRKQIRLLKGQNENKEIKEKLIAEKLLSMPEIVNSDSVFIYLAKSGEVATENIIERLISDGKKVYVPKTVGQDMFAVEYKPPFITTKFGTIEPENLSVAKSICVTVTPLVAVDKRFNRLGYGKGFYDRFFATDIGEKSFKVGVCFDFQVVEDITPDKFDKTLDAIVSEEILLRRN